MLCQPPSPSLPGSHRLLSPLSSPLPLAGGVAGGEGAGQEQEPGGATDFLLLLITPRLQPYRHNTATAAQYSLRAPDTWSDQW